MATQRLNYFTGQFLREADFKVEQGYHLGMRRTHNQRAHTAGIVTGLEVTAGSSQVTVRAGMAIDAEGREILVATDTAVPVTPGSGGFYVVLALDERKTDPAVDPDPIHTETRWTESPVFDVVAAVPAGAVGLAQIASVAGSGAVSLATGYRRVFSAPAVGGDLTVGRDLTVLGNLEVKGQTTVIQTELAHGDVVLGDNDNDTTTIEGTLRSGHSSGALQISSSTVINGSLSLIGAPGHLVVQGNTTLGDADSDTITIRGSVLTGHSSGRVRLTNPLDVNGDIFVSGNVDGRDVSADGTKLDGHVANASNPHGTTAAQVDAQGGSNRIVAQINAGTGVIADARIDSTIARASSFNATNGHDHDGTDSKKIIPGNLEGVNSSVTANALNILTGGPTSNAAALHTHPFSPADGTVNLQKLDHFTRARLLKAPALLQTLRPQNGIGLGNLSGGMAFDGSFLWIANQNTASVHKIDIASNAVTMSVTVDSGPQAVLFAAGAIWVANQWSATVSRIDVATNTVVATVGVGSNPLALAVNGNFLWVANFGGNTVSKIDMNTNAVVATVAVGAAPTAVLAVGAFLWVANQNGNSVSKIDLASNAVTNTVSVGNSPKALAATSATFLWVVNMGSNTVSKIDVGTNAVVATVSVTGQPYAALVIGGFLWVGQGGQTQKIDTTTNAVVATVSGGAAQNGNGMVSIGGFLWVCGWYQVTKIDVGTNTQVAAVPVMDLRGMFFDGLNLWVARFGLGQVSKLDLNNFSLLATINVGSGPHSFAFSGTHLFVTNSGSNTVSKIDPATNTVVATIPVGNGPTGIVFNPTYSTVQVANSIDGTVSTFNAAATAVGSTVPVGSNPQAMAVEGPYTCVINVGGNSISRLVGNVSGAVQSTIPLGATPSAIVFDYANLWVIVGAANSLTKIAAGSNTVSTVPLPTGVVPARMVFTGTHLLVLATNNQTFKVDVFNNAVSQPLWNAYLGSGNLGGVAFDGVFAWGVDAPSVTLWRAII